MDETATGPPGAHRRRRLRWQRGDCLALIVLLCAWAMFLAFQARTRTLALGPLPEIYPANVDSVRERIDPNTASVASLRRLPLIGPAKAKAIVEYRRRNSRPGAGQSRVFEYVEDLQNVPGIGKSIVAIIRKYTPLESRTAFRKRARACYSAK